MEAQNPYCKPLDLSCHFISTLLKYLTHYFVRAYAGQLSSYRSHCDSILNEVESALRHLQDLQQKHLLVSTKTGALHEACEQLLQDQVGMSSLMFLHRFVTLKSPKIKTVLQCARKQTIPNKNTFQQLSFERSHFAFSSADSKVRTTL